MYESLPSFLPATRRVFVGDCGCFLQTISSFLPPISLLSVEHLPAAAAAAAAAAAVAAAPVLSSLSDLFQNILSRAVVKQW